MLNCESCEILIADAIYDELDSTQQKKLQDHLDGCANCRAMYTELKDAIEQLFAAGVGNQSLDDIPERASLDSVFDRLEPALDKVDAEKYHQMPRRNIAPWAATITAIAASVIVFISLPSNRPGDPLTGTEQAQIVSPEGVNQDLMNYLDRAQVMLMQVANAENSNGSVIPVTNNFARNMAIEANFLSTVEDDNVNSGQKKLLKDIEFLLLQLANLDDSNMEEGVALMQRYLEENSVLFKIRLLEMRDQDLII
ncbi:MAG: hypothetical protein GKR91_15830 [Pseudomonadales bacterium]|nr:hypothetical protein [Pseudomonadales bacterium]